MPLDPANPWDKIVIDDVQAIFNGLFNPGGAPHSLLQDMLNLEQSEQQKVTALAAAVANLKAGTIDVNALASELHAALGPDVTADVVTALKNLTLKAE